VGERIFDETGNCAIVGDVASQQGESHSAKKAGEVADRAPQALWKKLGADLGVRKTRGVAVTLPASIWEGKRAGTVGISRIQSSIPVCPI